MQNSPGLGGGSLSLTSPSCGNLQHIDYQENTGVGKE